MAGKKDEDWDKFIESTKLPPEEVETDDELEDEPEEAEEDSKKQPDKSGDEASKDPDPEEDSEEDDSKEEDEDEGKKKTPVDNAYQPRLKQFFNTDGSLNVEKLEKSYIDSGLQAVELNKKVEQAEANYNGLLDAIKAKPDVAKALFGDEGTKKLTEGQPTGKTDGDAMQHSLLQHLEATMTNKSKAEYESFVEANPESVTDPEKVRKIGEFLKLHGAVYRKEHNGEIPGMKDSLEAAYRYHGWDLEKKDKEDVATAAKKIAATRTTPQGKRQTTKKEVSEGEQFFAKKLGIKLKS